MFWSRSGPSLQQLDVALPNVWYLFLGANLVYVARTLMIVKSTMGFTLMAWEAVTNALDEKKGGFYPLKKFAYNLKATQSLTDTASRNRDILVVGYWTTH